MYKLWRVGLLALAATLWPAGSAIAQDGVQGDPEAGRIKASTCMGCHGIRDYSNVYPTFSVPKIGGQHAAYIASALRAYKNGQRQHPTMTGQAKSLSEQDIADIAAFFASAPKE